MDLQDPESERILNAVPEIFNLYGQILLDSFQARIVPPTLPSTLPPGNNKHVFVPALAPITRVAVVGSGVAGLYAAMLLNKPRARYAIDILEADERIGGRLYTHHFPPANPEGKYDYFVSERELV